MEAKIVFIVSGKFRGGWADSSEKLEGGGKDGTLGPPPN